MKLCVVKKITVLTLWVILGCISSASEFLTDPYVTNPKLDGITIAWVTQKEIKAEVHYGETESYGSVGEEPKTTKVGIDQGGYAYNLTSEIFIHKVKIRGLKPGKKYFYKVVGENIPVYQSHFNTVPISSDAAVLIIFAGDRIIPSDDDVAFVESKAGKSADFYLDVGDHVVARIADKAVSKKWLSRVPLILAKGNHDNEDKHDGECQAFFDFDENQFKFPIAWGPLFMVVDGHSVYDPLEGDAFQWATKQFQNAKQPWKAYASHGIFFSDSRHRGEGPRRVAQFWPMFKQHGVQLEINGHDHDYQRTDRVNEEGKPDPNGTVSITFGGIQPDFYGRSEWSAFQWPPCSKEDMLEFANRKRKDKNAATKPPVPSFESMKLDDPRIPKKSVKEMKAEDLNAIPFILIHGNTARIELWTGSGNQRVLSDSYAIKLNSSAETK
jgi:hypothetical protein